MATKKTEIYNLVHNNICSIFEFTNDQRAVELFSTKIPKKEMQEYKDSASQNFHKYDTLAYYIVFVEDL